MNLADLVNNELVQFAGNPAKSNSCSVECRGRKLQTPTGSLLLYPAWRNMHAVTPIKATHEGGYRNSLVFYALKGFIDKE